MKTNFADRVVLVEDDEEIALLKSEISEFMRASQHILNVVKSIQDLAPSLSKDDFGALYNVYGAIVKAKNAVRAIEEKINE